MVDCRDGKAKMLEGEDCAVAVLGDGRQDRLVAGRLLRGDGTHLMEDSLGLDSCWLQGRLRKAEGGTLAAL